MQNTAQGAGSEPRRRAQGAREGLRERLYPAELPHRSIRVVKASDFNYSRDLLFPRAPI